MFQGEDGRLVDGSALTALAELRLAGEPDPVREVVDAFLEVTAGRLGELLQAAAVHDQHAVREIAHALKGSAGMVGATAMQAAAAEIEQVARSSNQDLVIGAQRLDEIFARTKPMLESLVRRGS